MHRVLSSSWVGRLTDPRRRCLSFYPSFDHTLSRQKQPAGGIVSGQILEHTVNLKRSRPGDVVNIPYEVTVGHGLRDFWQAAFSTHDRINTSTPFARSLGLQDELLERDVEKRFSTSDAAEHPWLGGLDKAIEARSRAADAVAAREAELNAEKAARLTKGRRRGARCRVKAAAV